MAETWTKGVLKDDGTPLFAFDTDNGEFARGFECGALFLQMALNPNPFESEIATTNSIMARRMAEALDRNIEIGEALDAERQTVWVGAKPPPEPQPLPEGFVPPPMPEEER